ncbi:MAG: hypothetical protein WC817_03880 [Patescibacteria group bacterium]|jgi:hypothetical protein
MSKYRNILIVILVALVVVFGGIVAYLTLRSSGSPKYTAVYLTTGEIYIGELARFPKLTLTNPYLLQLVREQAATDQSAAKPPSFQLVPLSGTVWAPQKLYLNPQQVIFSAPLRDDSKVVQGMNNKSK